MKKIISVLVLLGVTHIAFCQPPQGLNYQAVALGAGGQPLSNHNISLRLSVVDSSATGTAVYVETQSATTDTFGLFSVVIGSGTAVTGTFGGINWGHNNKWLKTEMDTAGGSNFALIGVTQFMSVPYALYAGQAKQDYSSIDYPDGLLNWNSIILFKNQTYTVPAGKNLYLHTVINEVIIDGTDTFSRNTNGGDRRPLGLSSGQTFLTIDTITGILVDSRVSWLTQNVTTSPYTVPAGYDLVILNCSEYNLNNSFNQHITIDGISTSFNYFGIEMLHSGQTIANTSPVGAGYIFINGYLRPQ
jgi:hypothetical protein